MKDKKLNDFRESTKLAIITNVNPQDKTIDIEYLSQEGYYKNLKLPYSNVGATWGQATMPVKGDKVLIDNSMGGKPVIKAMYPPNTDLLPYMDPGEISHSNSNGSYFHMATKKKRVASTNQIVDYDATVGPNGETDLVYQPGGITIQAKSRKDQNNASPNFYNHSYLGIFDNGDVALESMFQDKNKALIHMDGASGHMWIHAGDGKVQEYVELNPLRKEIVTYSDGDIHSLSQAYSKNVVYKDEIDILGGAYQFSTGVKPSTIGATGNTAYFDRIVTSGLNPGDMMFSATNGVDTSGGNVTWQVYQGFSVYTQMNDILLMTSGGPGTSGGGKGSGSITLKSKNDAVYIYAGESVIEIDVDGNIYLTANGNSQPNIYIDASPGNIYMQGSDGDDTDRIATIKDIQNHGHAVAGSIGSPTGGIQALGGSYVGTAKGYISN